MTKDVSVSCTCGKVKGVIHGLSAASSNHVQCPCKGCQSYAHYLGRAADMLDEAGYSNIFQIDPVTFEIKEGLEHLACVRMTPKGPLRWYTDCCKTPLGNTLPKGGVPFLGVLPICTGYKGTDQAVVEMVGPVRAVANEKRPQTLAEKLKVWGMLAHLMRLLLWWRIRGGKSWKPFFDKDTLRPIRKPITISKAESKALAEKVV
ncbi:DUF6151 family protein [Kordiimonas lipolytica]|uniref:DUF6151 family protein n=1 Tax=Kordiimonas lipolytica TaxID=1662421 RepID=A0ABV8U9H6_9PROT|nr:DUF6151 family protein [Kordiimonas lipolytica]